METIAEIIAGQMITLNNKFPTYFVSASIMLPFMSTFRLSENSDRARECTVISCFNSTSACGMHQFDSRNYSAFESTFENRLLNRLVIYLSRRMKPFRRWRGQDCETTLVLCDVVRKKRQGILHSSIFAPLLRSSLRHKDRGSSSSISARSHRCSQGLHLMPVGIFLYYCTGMPLHMPCLLSN
jgi:hypothetical protein